MTMAGGPGTSATDGTHVLKIDRTIKTPHTQKMYLTAYTRGLKSIREYIQYQVCSTDALARSANHTNSKIEHIYYKNMADLWHENERVTNNWEHRKIHEVNDCDICKDHLSFRILNYDRTAYTGDRLRLD
jgi:hypothetical protein